MLIWVLWMSQVLLTFWGFYLAAWISHYALLGSIKWRIISSQPELKSRRFVLPRSKTVGWLQCIMTIFYLRGRRVLKGQSGGVVGLQLLDSCQNKQKKSCLANCLSTRLSKLFVRGALLSLDDQRGICSADSSVFLVFLLMTDSFNKQQCAFN